ncbi:MAG: flagellar filament capping protein FliD [Sulfuricurvum sp.]|nr:flagellar filament capping protein FliD [Sulfuricurvum sp.]
MSISSLGAGSGVLTQTVIDQLKAADTKSIITPIDNKITLEKQKGQALNLLGSLLTTFQTSVGALNDPTLYQKRTVSGNTASVSVTANPGVNIQSFSITNTQLALNNVQESGSFSSDTATVSSGAGTMSITSGGIAYNIGYTATTTLSDLAASINSAAGTSVKASVLQVGATDYRLVLNSVKTGAGQTVSVSDSTSGTLNNQLFDATTKTSSMQDIQTARDASLTYNGITVTRSTNNITDIASGVTINLLQDAGSANIAITQDVQSVSDAMSSFVQNYNTLTSQLSSMTSSDTTTGSIGVFSGDSSINSITRQINQMVTSVSSKGYSLPQFGIDLSQTGVMSFTDATFKAKFTADPTASEAFLSTTTSINTAGNAVTSDGVFTSLNTLMNTYTSGTGLMSILNTGNTTNITNLTTNRTNSQALLDARYAAMAARFIQYDTIMSHLTQSFSALSSQISAYSYGKG